MSNSPGRESGAPPSPPQGDSGPAPDLESFLARAGLPPGWRVVYEPVVSSTNDRARAEAERGGPERSVFVADYQTAGRGRQGRTWIAPPRSGLLMSVLFRQSAAPPQHYTMLASLAAAEAIERLLGVEVAVKWPNDLLVGGRKVAGVLAEAITTAGSGYVIVGIGLNVNLSDSDLEVLPSTATALNRAAGRPVDRGELLAAILEQLDAWLALPPERRSPAAWRAWNARLWGRQQAIRVAEGGAQYEGIVEGTLQDGTLLVRSADGVVHRIVSGEVIL